MTRWPDGGTKAPRISSPYGPRKAPTPGASTNHRGTDFIGFSDVRAVADGVVTVSGTPAGWYGGGLQVWIKHAGYVSRSMHLRSLAVEPGEPVKRGDVIGVMGMTGTATGVHLHFEILPDGASVQVDPVPFLERRVAATLAPPLAVDGVRGPLTNKALQLALGVEPDGIVGPITIRAMQKRIGAIPDGVWGRQTTAALQRYLRVRVDAVMGPQTISALQRRLNEGTF